jgi:hypothetical protein
VLLQLIVGDPSVKVVVHLPHELKNLLLGDEEAHALERLVELVYFDELILVKIYLVEHFFQSQPFLFEHFEQMVKDVVVSHHALLFLLQFGYSPLVVFLIETVELCNLDNAVSIFVDFKEECGHLWLPEREVKMATQSCLEILESQETDSRVETGEGLIDGHGSSDPLLNCSEHSQALQLLLEPCGDSSVVSSRAAFGEHRLSSRSFFSGRDIVVGVC